MNNFLLNQTRRKVIHHITVILYIFLVFAFAVYNPYKIKTICLTGTCNSMLIWGVRMMENGLISMQNGD